MRDLASLPKAHLHLHLEAGMSPELLAELSAKYEREVPVVRGYGSFAVFSDTYVAATDSLYALGTIAGAPSGPAIPSLLRFDFDTPTSTPAQSWPIGSGDWLNTENIVALARNPTDAKLYGLSWLPFAGSTRLVRFDFSGSSVTLTPIGSGVMNGIAVLAGPAAIDPVANVFVAVGRNPDGSDASHVVSFNLTSGNVTAGAPIQAAGLWYDAGTGLDRIFANGFE
jgi:hypothetical protein